MRKMLVSLFKYIISGSIAFIVNITIFWLLINMTNIWYLSAATISFSISLSISFILHKNFTYKDRTIIRYKKILLFYTTNIINVIVNSVFLYVFVEFLELNKIISLIISNIIISIYSYIIYKKIIFK